MLGGTASSCSWFAFELSWKTAKGRACVNVKRRIQTHRNTVSSLGFAQCHDFSFTLLKRGAAWLLLKWLQLSVASSESWIKVQVFCSVHSQLHGLIWS